MNHADRSQPAKEPSGPEIKWRNLFAGAAFLAAITLLVLIGWLGYRILAELRGATERVTHTHQVIEELQEVLTHLADAETGQRGFIITGDERYLKPYIAALGEADKDLATLKALTADNPEQHKRLTVIEATVRVRLDTLRANIEIRKTRGFKVTRALLLAGKDRMLTNTARSQVDEASAVEMKLLQERSTLLAKKIAKVNYTLLAGSLLAVVLLGAAFMVLKREITRRGRVESTLDRQQKQLYVMLEERRRATNELTRQRKNLEKMNERLEEEATERIKAQELLKTTNAELEEANVELEAFNYSVAHDLRKPLTAVNGYCQAIRELCDDKLDEQCSGYLQGAYDGTLRMNRLIDTLLNFSRLTRIELKLETVDLSGLAQVVATDLKLADPTRRAAFQITEGLTAAGDASLLRVVLDNLLGNAWKYTGMRDEAVIEFGEIEIDGKTAYFVRDNGAGFAAADADKLFIPFQRLTGAEEYKGFGIGLATVDRIIRRHGGKIWAEGEEGKGATFYFMLGSALSA
jgi:signal transduction histidine kinase